VPVSPATVEALAAHWRDRGLDFHAAETGPLLKPLLIPGTTRAKLKYRETLDLPYDPDSINHMVRWAMKRLIAGMPELSAGEMAFLAGTSPHAFRHTFGTHAAANDVPLDVVQRVLGHASLQTTSIYVQAEQQRMMREAALYYSPKETAPT